MWTISGPQLNSGNEKGEKEGYTLRKRTLVANSCIVLKSNFLLFCMKKNGTYSDKKDDTIEVLLTYTHNIYRHEVTLHLQMRYKIKN